MRPRKGVLLDTHVVLWALRDSDLLGARLRRVLNSDVPLFFSAISSAEISIKVQLGLLATPPGLGDALSDLGLRELPFDTKSGEAMTRFPGLVHHDPFDRMLVAQAAAHDMTLETGDRQLLSLGLPHINDATA